MEIGGHCQSLRLMIRATIYTYTLLTWLCSGTRPHRDVADMSHQAEGGRLTNEDLLIGSGRWSNMRSQLNTVAL